jgi:hypothetical protein
MRWIKLMAIVSAEVRNELKIGLLESVNYAPIEA